MRKILRESHIGISPSIVREAGPLAMIEQMAFGLAVITSNNGSQPEFIQDGVNGLLCPPQDPQALADALRRLITDPTLRHQLGEQAQRDFFALHTYDRFIEDMYHLYAEIYEKVL
jgi:glycosyltransferase involved in cell wall biosynthesis